MLRSFLYAHFAESLSGLPTIRSYGEIPRFLSDNEYYTDLEDRAAYLTVTNQRYAAPGKYDPDYLLSLRWLAIRLDFLGGLMTFVVRIMKNSHFCHLLSFFHRLRCLPLPLYRVLTQHKSV
jgi:ATP-binding cassette, subfamily C (CFTR/MRP), member 1